MPRTKYPTIREERVGFRVAGPLLAELERAAMEERRTLSAMIRDVLIDYAADRAAQREQVAA
jgi:hypothetical protein